MSESTKAPGRPATDDPMVVLQTSLPAAAAAEINRLAAVDRLAVASILRVLVLEALRARGWTA